MDFIIHVFGYLFTAFLFFMVLCLIFIDPKAVICSVIITVFLTLGIYCMVVTFVG